MAPPSVPALPRHAARRHALRRSRSSRRARRLALAVLTAAVVAVTLFLTAFGPGGSGAINAPLPPNGVTLPPAGPPQPLVVAAVGSLRLQLPISQQLVTAIAYHAPGERALALDPYGRQANQGLLARLGDRLFGGGEKGLPYYLLGGGVGPSTGALDVAAPAGTDVYSPVDGSVVGITPYILNGRRYGARIDVQPSGAPSMVVSLTRLRPDPGLSVGSTVAAGTSKVGALIDFSTVERQALARHTHDAGNHVTVEVYPAATLAIP